MQAYLIHIADRSDANFRRVLEIKGIRSKQEQSQLVELFQAHRASDRHAPNLQASNPMFALIHSSSSSHHPSASTSGPAAGPQGLVNLSTSAAASLTNSTRFDPSVLGSAIISAAKDGVDRIGHHPGLSTSSAADTPQSSSSPAPPSVPGSNQQESTNLSNATTNLNENLRNIGKFFRRDLGGFGGRFGRGGEDGNR